MIRDQTAYTVTRVSVKHFVTRKKGVGGKFSRAAPKPEEASEFQCALLTPTIPFYDTSDGSRISTLSDDYSSDLRWKSLVDGGTTTGHAGLVVESLNLRILHYHPTYCRRHMCSILIQRGCAICSSRRRILCVSLSRNR